MICSRCAAAADLASGRDGTSIEAGPGLASVYALAAALHGRCQGCTCQHQVGEIRPTLPDPQAGGAS